jgi:hypothetical protein
MPMRVGQCGVLFLNMLILASAALGQGPATPPITIAPSDAVVLTSRTVPFTATRSGNVDNTTTKWQVKAINGTKAPQPGSITPIGPTAVYTAPDNTRTTTRVKVTAVSADGASASANVLIVMQPTIIIMPSAATLATPECKRFTPIATSDVRRPVKWRVNKIDGGNAVVGSIDSTGKYCAPSDPKNAGSVTITAVPADTNNDDFNPKIVGTAVASIVPPSCSGDHCIEIVLAKHPSALLSSFPVDRGKRIKLAAISPTSSKTISARWTVNDDPRGNSAIGTLNPPGDARERTGDSETYTGPTAPGPSSITIKATADGYTPATVNIIVVPVTLIPCHYGEQSTDSDCTVLKYDRLAGRTGEIEQTSAAGLKAVDESTDPGVVSAINSAKTIFSGSVISAQLTGDANASNCANYDWKIAVQSEESASIFIYDPSDVGSGVCEGDRFIVALPLHVLWADVFGYHQNLDPARGAPAKPSSYSDCVGQPAPQTITPCDKDTTTFIAGLYKTGWLYNHFTPPGNGKGTIGFTGKGRVVFDIQADPAYKAGVGWINIPVMFERGSLGASLNSLTFAGAYDFRWVAHPDLWEPTANSSFIFRKPQFQIRSGLEMSPDRPGTASTSGQDHDWNYVWGEVVRFPLVINFHDQPSSFSFYPVFGAEEGWHLATNLSTKDPIARGVAGADGSFRWPFNATHNFLGSTPITFEAQYRVRWLAYPEPFADFANLPAAGTPPPCPNRVGIGIITPSAGQQTCGALEVLSDKAQSFFKGDITVPVDPYIQVTLSVTKGSLPPDFWLIGWTYSLGLSFGNNASAEH